MLAAIIANLQNIGPSPQPRPPTVKIDRGGAGPAWPGYDIVDILGALQSFREVPGEHPVARAARRHQHIGEHLDQARRTREAREGAAFLAGAVLAHQAAEQRRIETEAELAKVVAAYDELRAEQARSVVVAPPRAGRGTYRAGASMSGVAIAAVLVAGIAIGVAIARR